MYDSRNIHSKRCYLQAVLAARTLFSKGCKEFQSNRAQVYYRALMKHPKPNELAHNLKKADYALMLKDVAGESIPLPAPVVASKRAGTGAKALENIDGDDGAAVPKRRAVAPIGDGSVDGDGADSKDGDASSSSSSSSSSSGKAGSSIDGEDDPSVVVAKTIEGCKTRVECHSKSGDRGIRLTCKYHGHGCRKFRSLVVGGDIFGALSASYFLGAWIQEGESLSIEEHKSKTNGPTLDEVKAYVKQL
jgi:hypothetical protein